MNIFLRELRANFKSLMIWSGISILFTTVGFSKFSAFYENPELLAIMDAVPPAVLDALDMNAFNLTSVSGFYGMMTGYFSLLLSIAAVMWGSDIISKEERHKTVEFSLTLPVTRSRLVTAKAAAALVNCIILLLVTWGAVALSAGKYNPDADFFRLLALSMPAFFLIQLVFLCSGIFLGCTMRQHKKSSATAVSILLVSYFLSMVMGLSEKLLFLRYFTPFKYFDVGLMLRESRLEPRFVLLSVAIAGVAFFGAHRTYAKRDMMI